MIKKIFNHWSVLPVTIMGLVVCTVLRGMGVG